MKRRNADCGKLRRPIKRNKITDGMSSTTILYLKFLILWAIVITADFMFMVRFEFLWPFWMLLRSVHDSFKYKGLAFSVLFVCIAITSDLICLFFIPVNWLLFAASTYVWVQYVWHTDKGICLPTIILWMLFVYLEAGIRWKDSRHMPHLDLCRPFAAHCIGYPVVTLGFGFKSYVGYRMRQRKQREVAKENEFYMQLLQQALPQDESVNTTANNSVNSNVSISNSLCATSSTVPSDELSIRLQNGCAGHQPKLPTSSALATTTTTTTSATNSTSSSTTATSTATSKDDGSSPTSFFSSCSSTSSSSSSSSSQLSTTSTSMNSNSLLSSNNNNNNSSSKSAAQNKLNYNVCNNSNGNSVTVTSASNGHVKNRRNNNNNNHDKTNSSSSHQMQNGKIYQQIKDLKEVSSSNSASTSNGSSSTLPSSKNHYENCNGSTNNKKNQHQQSNGSLPKGNHSSSDYQVNETSTPPQQQSEKPKKKKSKKNDSNNHQKQEKENHHQNNNSQNSKDLNSDTSSISSSTSSSTSTLTNLASHVVSKICDACLKFEADIMKYRSEITQMKQIESDLRQKLDSSNQQLKNCLQAKQKECESLESRLQNIKSLRKTEQANYTELERTLREEQRKRQSLEAQLQNEKVARSKAEEKAQMNNHRVDCTDQCKQRRQQLDSEVKRLRRDFRAAEEAKVLADQETQRIEQKFAMFEQEIRSREPQSKMLMAALNAMQDKNVNLEKNLTAETRVKLDLFSALGEAKRQIEIKNSLLYSRQEEVQELKAKIAELLAVLPSDNLCLPSTSNGPSSPLLNLHQQLLSGHQLNQRVNGDYLPPQQPQNLQPQPTSSHTPTSSGGGDA